MGNFKAWRSWTFKKTLVPDKLKDCKAWFSEDVFFLPQNKKQNKNSSFGRKNKTGFKTCSAKNEQKLSRDFIFDLTFFLGIRN